MRPLFLNFVTQENRENWFHAGFVRCEKLLELENKTYHSALALCYWSQ
jgi:hypothetical protein